MRDLAQVCTVSSVNKMYQKDLICWITVEENAYEYIMPNTTKVGDKVVVIGEGSLLPEIERWEFLRKRCYREDLKRFLIKPMTMGAKDFNGEKGDRVKSWGLCVTLSEAGLSEDLKPGTDVTDKLDIKKYEDEIDASPVKMTKIPRLIKFLLKYKLTRWIGDRYLRKRKKKYFKGSFPVDIISKSDETTIQNCPSVMNQFPGKRAYITAKMEGQSFTCSLDAKNKYKFYICSRNNRLVEGQSDSTVFYNTAKRYDIANKLKDYYNRTGRLLIIQGEQVGPTIQFNIYNFDEVKWFVFRMKELVNKQWEELNYDAMKDIAKELGLELVPLIEVVEDMSKFDTIESLVNYAENIFWAPNNLKYKPNEKDKLWKDYFQHEGIVIKSDDYNKERNIGFSFKVKNLQYAEKGLNFIHENCAKLIIKDKN